VETNKLGEGKGTRKDRGSTQPKRQPKNTRGRNGADNKEQKQESSNQLKQLFRGTRSIRRKGASSRLRGETQKEVGELNDAGPQKNLWGVKGKLGSEKEERTITIVHSNGFFGIQVNKPKEGEKRGVPKNGGSRKNTE